MNTMRSSRLAERRTVFGFLLLAGAVSAGCEFLDPTNVENPQTTADDLAAANNPTASLLPGLRAQMARLVSSTTVLAEVVSDNFSIHGTGLNQAYDTPTDITPSVSNSMGGSGAYWHAQELRALAAFVIEDVAPFDTTASAENVAEAYYYRGMANLYLGEGFSFVPTELDGVPAPADRLLDLAIADLGLASAFGTATDAALARAYRWKGDEVAAAEAAQSVLDADANYLFLQEYDATSISNGVHTLLVLRALQDMQPLPRLDFLDPKYLDRAQGIAVAKAEEMHLILAEIALVNGDIAGTQSALREAINLAQSRPTTSFQDGDPRFSRDLSIRPRDASIEVRADASGPYRAGLVLSRPGTVSQALISGSSLDADSVASLATEAELWHAFHLARQEILFLEGRRMADLGIRLPMMLREVDANPNISDGDPGTIAVVPGYIPAGNGMDLFTPASPYDANGVLTTTQVTIDFDMNMILATNRVSPFN